MISYNLIINQKTPCSLVLLEKNVIFSRKDSRKYPMHIINHARFLNNQGKQIISYIKVEEILDNFKHPLFFLCRRSVL